MNGQGLCKQNVDGAEVCLFRMDAGELKCLFQVHGLWLLFQVHLGRSTYPSQQADRPGVHGRGKALKGAIACSSASCGQCADCIHATSATATTEERPTEPLASFLAGRNLQHY